MNIKPRQKGKMWVADVPTGARLSNGKLQYSQVRGATKSECQKEIKDKIITLEISKQALAMQQPKHKDKNFGQAASDYKKDLEKREKIYAVDQKVGLSPASASNYKSESDNLCRFMFNDKPLKKYAIADINKKFVKDLKLDLIAHTDPNITNINRWSGKLFQRFKAILDYYESDTDHYISPAKSVDGIVIDAAHKPAPEKKVIAPIVSTLREEYDIRLYLLIWLTNLTGGRFGEAILFKMSKVINGEFKIYEALDRYQNIFKTKSANLRKDGNGVRYVALSPKIISAFKDVQKQFNIGDDDYFFEHDFTGRQVHPFPNSKWVREEVIYKICDKHNIERVGFKGFRRFFATQTKMVAGASDKEAQQRLGHKNGATTDGYITYQDPRGQEHAEIIEDSIFN